MCIRDRPFFIGGTSGMFATAVIQPIDTIKVRIQLESESQALSGGKGNFSPLVIGSQLIKTEGVRGLYKGLDSALVRQALYATSRLGIYKTISEHIKQRHPERDLSFTEKGYSSIIGGFFGSLIANPADLILVRFQADGHLPVTERRNYRNFLDAFVRIIREEGVLALWRGSAPTVLRAVLANFSTLAPYDEVKERLNHWRRTKDDLVTRLTASAIASIVGVVICLPADNVKIKLQKMKKGSDGKFPYSGLFDCFVKSVQREGIFRLWVGMPTFYMRVAPHVMLTLVIQDYITDLVKRFRGKGN
eukprot:TRINITY_DN8948_c0_g1_i2.p1 TRINITY_DN8948_c0_g1~~TRINITY_DN8948_c0_g1_i2.p1  ORF type:complete len:328 (+),score=45.21 TRINITY_DN8948_c0_g1_i2:75-986(+)